jgi:hypothetical protein
MALEIHHVASSAADDAELVRFRAAVTAAGAPPAPIIDPAAGRS